MAHVSSSWQHALVRTLERLLLSGAPSGSKSAVKTPKHASVSRTFKTPKLSARRNALLTSGGWWLALPFAIALLFQHPDLLLAIVAGSVTMFGVYLATTSESNIDWVAVSRLGDRLRQPVLLAIAAGALVSLLAYVSLAVWGATDNHWIAATSIAQGAALLGILTLLAWQTLVRLTGRDRVDVTPMLLQVADEDGLKRAIAIRQLGLWLEQRRLDRAEQTAIAACLQYLLSQETDRAIRDAALDVLQTIHVAQASRRSSDSPASPASPALGMAAGKPVDFPTAPPTQTSTTPAYPAVRPETHVSR